MIVEIIEYANYVSVDVTGVVLISINENNIPAGLPVSAFTQKGGVLAGTGSGTFAEVAPGVDGQFLQYDSSLAAGVRPGTPSISIEDTTNYLVNPGWDFAQEQTPGTWTTIADGSYSADQWKCYRENADLQYRRVDASGVSGLTSPYHGEYKKITNAGKIMVLQPLEYLNTVRFRGKTISFQLQMNSNVARTMKIAIIELQSAGVANTIPAVVSAWNVDGTDPSLGANLAVIGTPVSCAVTTSMQVFQFSGEFPTTSKNLIVAVWSDADLAVNDTVGMAEAGLRYGASLRSWTPIDYDQQILKIQRFVWKTFEIDTAPVQNLATAAFRFIAGKAGAVAQNGTIMLPVPMMKTPAYTTYNPYAANAQARDTQAPGDCSATSLALEGSTLYINTTGNAATAVGNRLFVHALLKAQM